MERLRRGCQTPQLSHFRAHLVPIRENPTTQGESTCSCIRNSHMCTHKSIHTPSRTTAMLCQRKGQGDSLKGGQFHSHRLEADSSALKAVLAVTQPDCITKRYCREKKNKGDHTTPSSRDCNYKDKTSAALLVYISWMQTLLLQDPHPHWNRLHSTAMWASAPRQETSAACFVFRWCLQTHHCN